jgi:hypothetical protein
MRERTCENQAVQERARCSYGYGQTPARIQGPLDGDTRRGSGSFLSVHPTLPRLRLQERGPHAGRSHVELSRLWSCPRPRHQCGSQHQRRGLALARRGAHGEPKRLRRGGKTTDGGAPQRTKNPTALAVRSVNVVDGTAAPGPWRTSSASCRWPKPWQPPSHSRRWSRAPRRGHAAGQEDGVGSQDCAPRETPRSHIRPGFTPRRVRPCQCRSRRHGRGHSRRPRHFDECAAQSPPVATPAAHVWQATSADPSATRPMLLSWTT